MIKVKYPILFLAGLVFVLLIYFQKMNGLVVGIYDPDQQLADIKQIKYEEIYLSWDDNIEEAISRLKSIQQEKRISIITLEPWPVDGSNSLLNDISQGKYDKTIDNICERLGNRSGNTLMRWGHEMERKGSRYPWAGQNPNDYIQAYRHFVEQCRKSDNDFSYMWSPAGDEGSESYWPGKEFVDFVGLSVYDNGQWDRMHNLAPQSFSEILTPKYNRIKQFNKPVIISEMGVTGEDSYKAQWLRNAFSSFSKFPLLDIAVYFNSKDVQGSWGENISTPDWTLGKEATQVWINK